MFICEFANGRYLAAIRSPHVILLQTQHYYLVAIDEFHHAMNLPSVHIPERENWALPAVDITGPPRGGHTPTGGHRTDTEVALVSQVCLERVSATVWPVVSSATLCILMITLANRGATWPAQAKPQAPEKVPFDHLDLTEPTAEDGARVPGAGWGTRGHGRKSTITTLEDETHKGRCRDLGSELV